MGARRAANQIAAHADRHRAGRRVVMAAFGFLATTDGVFVDVLRDNSEDSLTSLGILPRDPEVAAAFALSRAVHPEGGMFIAD